MRYHERITHPLLPSASRKAERAGAGGRLLLMDEGRGTGGTSRSAKPPAAGESLTVGVRIKARARKGARVAIGRVV
jgi:hypothetical protein